MNIMALRKEKYDLETICIKQEECIRSLKKKNKFFEFENKRKWNYKI